MNLGIDSISRGVGMTGAPRLFPARGPLIVMYHGLGGGDGVDPAAFAEQIELLRSRRRIVPLAQLAGRLGSPAARELAAITFDDGYVDFAEHALPVLRSKDLHATLFVPAGRVGGWNEWDAGTHAKRRILDAEKLRRLDQDHVEIGGHGYSHRRLAGLDPRALDLETLGCRRELEGLLDRPIRLFAYPYGQRGDFDSAAERAVEEAGFRLACSTCFGRSSGNRHRFQLRRVGINPGDDLNIVAAKLDGAYDWVAWKERAGHVWRSLIGRRREAIRGRLESGEPERSDPGSPVNSPRDRSEVGAPD